LLHVCVSRLRIHFSSFSLFTFCQCHLLLMSLGTLKYIMQGICRPSKYPPRVLPLPSFHTLFFFLSRIVVEVVFCFRDTYYPEKNRRFCPLSSSLFPLFEFPMMFLGLTLPVLCLCPSHLSCAPFRFSFTPIVEFPPPVGSFCQFVFLSFTRTQKKIFPPAAGSAPLCLPLRMERSFVSHPLFLTPPFFCFVNFLFFFRSSWHPQVIFVRPSPLLTGNPDFCCCRPLLLLCLGLLLPGDSALAFFHILFLLFFLVLREFPRCLPFSTPQ